nr:pyridoxamine 5'-phosphate oxidase family protein [Streptomyces sp. NBC_01264]
MMDHEATARKDVRGPEMVPTRCVKPLDRTEALRLLATVSLGRIVFTEHALPAVRPVSHLVDGEDLIVRIQGSGAFALLPATPDAPAVVVAYEADAIDPETCLGWSVVVTGYASLIGDDDEADRYEALLLPWASQTATKALRIRPDLVTGFRLGAEAAHPAPGAST